MEASRFATRWSEIEEVTCSLVGVLDAQADGHAVVTSRQGSDLLQSSSGLLSKSLRSQEAGVQLHTVQPGSNRLLFMVRLSGSQPGGGLAGDLGCNSACSSMLVLDLQAEQGCCVG